MSKMKRIRTSAKESPAQSKTTAPSDTHWGADETKCHGEKWPVNAGGIVWTVNAEPPPLAWIINAVSCLAGWDLLATVKKRDDAVSRIDQIERIRCGQNSGLVGGLDDPYNTQRHEVATQHAVFVQKDLDGGMEVNYWLHRALLISPEDSLKATYKRLRIIHTLPRRYDAARPITQANWEDAKRDYQDIQADAYAAAHKSTPSGQGEGNAQASTVAGRPTGSGDVADETGLVKCPTDENAYRAASKVVNDYSENFPTIKDLNKTLNKHPEIRRWKPSQQRLTVHLGDLQKYLDSKANVSSDGWSDVPADVERRKAQVTKNKNKSARK